MKYHVMWHPKMGWGPQGAPALLKSRLDAVRGTGLSLTSVRRSGWKWMTLVIPEPWLNGERDELTLRENIKKMIDRYEASNDYRVLINELKEVLNEDDGDGSKRDVVAQGTETTRGEVDQS